MKKPSILVTGSNGLIAKTFIEQYRDKFKFYECTKKDKLDFFLKKKPELILNTAGEQYNEKKMVETNLLYVEKILNHLIKNKSHLITLGSSAEYGVRNFPTSEKTLPMPATKYEATKSAASMMVTGYSRAYNLKAIVVRPYSVYGHHSKNDRLIPMIIDTINNDTKMKIYRAFHDFIYVLDFNRGIFNLIQNRNKWGNGEIVNLGSGKQYSNFEVLKTVQSVFGKNSGKFKKINKFFKKWDSNMWLCDTRFAFKKYSFKTKFNLEKGLADYKKRLENNETPYKI
jgi:nucleoside-diphosphate-sugar epimerase